MSSFDLVTERWLPVRVDDVVESVGLRELFLRAQELDDIVVSLPPAASGLWRVLTVIAARVTGLDQRNGDADDWADERAAVHTRGRFNPDAVTKYFDHYADRFDLFSPTRPWMQDPRLLEECAASSGINKLVLARSSGSNQVWFDHHNDRLQEPVPAATAVLHLIAQMYYGPSGRCTARTVAGRSEANTTAGPLRRAISFHPVGRSVFESLVVGLPCPESRRTNTDVAMWERPELDDPLGIPPLPTGVGGVLAGRFRHAILLAPSSDGREVVDAWITWAWRLESAPVDDPYLVYDVNKSGDRFPRRADLDRAIWRDLDGLLHKEGGVAGRRRPYAFDDLPESVEPYARVRALGFDQDGQTRDRQWYVGVLPPVLAMSDDPVAAVGVQRIREAAEEAQVALHRALRDVWVAINDVSNGDWRSVRKDIGDGPWPAEAAARYWPLAESRFWSHVWARDFDQPDIEFMRIARDVYDMVTEQVGIRPRVRRAVERARRFLWKASGPPVGERKSA